ncbi:hypothetical protein SI65_04169 [Aspergillus cristatus]|uniref:CCHC-type domain-containing protein n=1 Tax=Aspergillus cristatus TaxID=573508 RepID=A0A1E3BL51_ASPCR|nr:hypothetical protein SI65_04169 [Aspergillus cristatus]
MNKQTEPAKMAQNATEQTQSQCLTLDMKEQGQKIITHNEFLAQCCEHPDKLFNYVANTFNKQDEYKTAYAEAQLCSHGSTVESTKPSGKSEKVPDPPLLTDGKEPKFKDWMIEMKGKFMANADHFDNDQMKRVYLVSCTGDATDPYTSVEQMFKTLTTAFQNPHCCMEADAELQTMYMHPGDKFPEFLAKQLTDKVKELSLPYIGDDKTFDEFTAYVGTVVQSLNANAQETKHCNLSQNSCNNPNVNHLKASNSSGSTQLDNNTQQELMSQGKCFHCKEAGHMFQDCPCQKKNSNTIQLCKIEAVPEASNNNLGKEDA